MTEYTPKPLIDSLEASERLLKKLIDETPVNAPDADALHTALASVQVHLRVERRCVFDAAARAAA